MALVNDAEREILESAARALGRTTGLAATFGQPPTHAPHCMDALVAIQTANGDRSFIAEIKAVDRFQTPGQVKAQLTQRAELPLLVAPFISRETAERCRELHLSFIDTAGNAFLEAPGLYVYVTGFPRAKRVEESRFRALGAAGLQVTFTLLARPALVDATYREIARAAATALGSITHVMRDLEARGFLMGDKHRRLLDPQRLLDEWVTHYPYRPPSEASSTPVRGSAGDSGEGGSQAAWSLLGRRTGSGTSDRRSQARRIHDLCPRAH